MLLSFCSSLTIGTIIDHDRLVWAMEKPVIHTYIVLLALLLPLRVSLLPIFSLGYVDTVCAVKQGTWTWSIIITILYADVRVCVRTSRYIPDCCSVRYAAVAAAAAACCCWSLSWAGWQRLLRRFTASDSGVFVLFIQTRFFSTHPLAVLSHFQHRFFT